MNTLLEKTRNINKLLQKSFLIQKFSRKKENTFVLSSYLQADVIDLISAAKSFDFFSKPSPSSKRANLRT
jgi:GTP-sensing pleiotropic transcriptional regulator CodY